MHYDFDMSSFPESSVFEKIQAVHPDGPGRIYQRMKELNQGIRDQELSALKQKEDALAITVPQKKQGLKAAFCSLARGFASIGEGLSLIIQGPKLPSSETTSELKLKADLSLRAQQDAANNMARIGDTMRDAIREYMSAHDLTADSLGLNEAERKSLVRIDPPKAPSRAAHFHL